MCCRHLAGRPTGEKHCRQDAGSTLAVRSHLFEVHSPNECGKTKGGLHEPPGEGTGPTRCRPGPLTRRVERFTVPMHARKRKEALQEPQSAAGILPADQPEKCTAGKMPAAPWRCGLTCSRFIVPMRVEKRKEAFHEPPGEGTGPTGCRPGPLTRRVERSMVQMHAKKRKEAFHEPTHPRPLPGGE